MRILRYNFLTKFLDRILLEVYFDLIKIVVILDS